jgi:hypothetical protein
MNRPNFFILGAPKCGTTSMYHWLNQHSMVFLPQIKEPHFFSTDLNDKKRAIKDMPSYVSLYQGAAQSHKLLGDASVFYLYSKKAVQNILKFNANAKFLVMLRNPVDMVVSLHAQYLFTGNEIYDDFRKAWNLQGSRLGGVGVRLITEDPQLLQYGKVCKLGEQSQDVYNITGGRNLLFSFLEDIGTNPETEFRKVLTFLGLPYEPVDFKTYNPATSRRFIGFHSFTKYLNYLKKQAGIGRINSGFGRLMTKITTKSGKKYPLAPEFRNELIDYFEKDIHALMELLNRDLSHWLEKS